MKASTLDNIFRNKRVLHYYTDKAPYQLNEREAQEILKKIRERRKRYEKRQPQTKGTNQS